jgi:DNA-binding transcriptional regulator YiaG
LCRPARRRRAGPTAISPPSARGRRCSHRLTRVRGHPMSQLHFRAAVRQSWSARAWENGARRPSTATVLSAAAAGSAARTLRRLTRVRGHPMSQLHFRAAVRQSWSARAWENGARRPSSATSTTALTVAAGRCRPVAQRLAREGGVGPDFPWRCVSHCACPSIAAIALVTVRKRMGDK